MTSLDRNAGGRLFQLSSGQSINPFTTDPIKDVHFAILFGSPCILNTIANDDDDHDADDDLCDSVVEEQLSPTADDAEPSLVIKHYCTKLREKNKVNSSVCYSS